eukprot:scaffold209208_cov14-Tisochrysis_lutea.AAC.1
MEPAQDTLWSISKKILVYQVNLHIQTAKGKPPVGYRLPAGLHAHPEISTGPHLLLLSKQQARCWRGLGGARQEVQILLGAP